MKYESKKIRLVAVACLSPFLNDKIKDRSYMSKFHGGEALTDMVELMQQSGYEVTTIDRYVSSNSNQLAFLVSDMGDGLQYKSQNLIPAICYSLESPIVASRYYHHIQNRTKAFRRIYDWVGISTRIQNSSERFIPIAWPNLNLEIKTGVQWEDRNFLVIINSNKKALQWHWPEFNFRNFLKFPRALISNLNTSWLKFIDPIMKNETYSERLRAIQYFSKVDGFDLYGIGWDRKIPGASLSLSNAIESSYRGKIPDKGKLDYLSKYKFSIVYENMIFPGYITEKIFDCFFAGVIPIYLGDPQIEKKIPTSCFIDSRKFRDFNELLDYLQSLTLSDASKYLESAKAFLESQEFEFFTSKNFASNILNSLNEINLSYE